MEDVFNSKRPAGALQTKGYFIFLYGARRAFAIKVAFRRAILFRFLPLPLPIFHFFHFLPFSFLSTNLAFLSFSFIFATNLPFLSFSFIFYRSFISFISCIFFHFPQIFHFCHFLPLSNPANGDGGLRKMKMGGMEMEETKYD